MIWRLFVYGSLKSGECNEAVLRPWLLSCEPARTRGRMLLRPDGYPALWLEPFGPLGSADYASDLQLQENGDAPTPRWGELIEGELVHLRPGPEAMARLDEFEGFFPESRSEYRRVMLRSDTENGPQVCWTYIGPDQVPQDWPLITC